jgi:hypothetical protein
MAVNWKRIVFFAVLLFASEVLAGFIEGGFSVGDLPAAKRQLVLSTCLSFGLSAAVFCAMSLRQSHRPFLHASLALLLTITFSLALAAAFPTLLGATPVVLVVFEWLTLVAGLATGTSVGRYIAGLRRRAPG